MSRPNIIVINPDQMRADALHHLGNQAAHTPNIDALAEDGVSFRNAFCQNPVCVPSRCSFMTGLYPHTNGHRTMGYLLRRGESNLFRQMKNAGYYVWSSGRGDCLAGQDTRWLKECTDRIYNKCGADRTKDEGRGSKDSVRYKSFYRGEVSAKHPDGICHDNDWQWTKGCEELIRNIRNDKPVFAFLGLNAPHPPYRAEKKYLDLIDETKLNERIPASGKDALKPSMQYALCDKLGLDGWDEENFVKMRKTYLAMCAKIDEMVGFIVKALKETGQYDNTAIFFFSDHGDFTGDYSIPEKAQNLFPDCLVNVPLIVKPPKGYSVDHGVNDNLAELIDYYATAMEYAGIEPDHSHFGRSLSGTISDKSVVVRDFVFSEGGRLMSDTHCTETVENYFGIKADEYEPRITIQQSPDGEHTKAAMIRTGEYKYIMRLYEKDEFYDLSKGEQFNQIDNPEYAEKVSEMKEKLLRLYMETCDEVPFEQDARFPDAFYFGMADAAVHFPVSPLLKAATKITRKSLSELADGAIKLLKIDTKKFYE